MTFLILLGYAAVTYIFKQDITTDTYVMFTGMIILSIAVANSRKH